MAEDGAPRPSSASAAPLDAALRVIGGPAGPANLHAALFHIQELAGKPSFYPALHALVAQVMNARNFAVVLCEPNGRLRYEYHLDEVEAVPPSESESRTLVAWVLRQGLPLLASPATYNTLVARGEVAPLERPLAAWIGVPLREEGQIIGAITAHSYHVEQALTAADLEALATVAAHVGSVIGRQRTVAALRESEQRFRALAETAPCAILIHQGGDVRYANDAAWTIAGMARAEDRPKSFWDLVHLDFQLPVKEHLAARRDARAVSPRLEFKIVRRDGQERWLDFSTGDLVYNGRPAVLGVGFDVTERKQAEEKVRDLAYRDELTGLPNRRLLQDRLGVAINDARRWARRLAVLFIDLDHFKDVNDSLGHAAGDQLLKVVSERLQAVLRAGDTVARLGGDEFVIVLNELRQAEDVAGVARKVLDILERPIRVADQELFVAASIGISVYPEDGRDPQTLVQHADAALYRAKDKGRRNYQLYTEAMQEQASQRLSLETDLRRALVRGELLLHYQPVVDLRSGRVHGVEALLRWNHPTRGLMSPAQFIAHAETSHTLAALGGWILTTACQQLAKWRAAGHRHLSMAVNLSARQFRDAGLVAQVRTALSETDTPAAQLDLEITEGHAMENADETLRTLQGLKGLGVRISIDDFGTGYSSLAYLKRFAIHTLKVDRSLLQDITTGEGDAAIAAAIIQLAHTLKLAVVAEGVETEEQLDFLRERDCDRVQGYVFSRPLASEEATAFIDRRGSVLAPERVVFLPGRERAAGRLGQP